MTYDEYDPDWDIAEDESEGGNWWAFVVLLAIIVGGVLGWHAENLYVTPPIVTFHIDPPATYYNSRGVQIVGSSGFGQGAYACVSNGTYWLNTTK